MSLSGASKIMNKAEFLEKLQKERIVREVSIQCVAEIVKFYFQLQIRYFLTV